MADMMEIGHMFRVILQFMFIFIFLIEIANSLAPPYYGLDRPALEYELPPLSYEFSDLEPYLDSETTRVHYMGHHSKFTENMNMVIKEWRRNARDKLSSRISIIDILKDPTKVPERYRLSVKNNGGGYVNHAFVWSVISKNPTGEERTPEGQLAQDIKNKFRSYLEFREVFTDMALNLFGSGYVWLCRNYSNPDNPKDLVIVQTANEDTPLTIGLHPILVVDVWEHAYYLKHQNQRGKYLLSWWYLVDWKAVSRLDDWWLGVRHRDEL